jgi:hypothetical protein
MNSRAGVGLALVAILGLAAALRFTALGWGLRHEPDWDERVFVQSAGWVVAAGDFDHRFYEYPGLAVYLLALAVAPHDPPEVGAPAYLAARRLVAGFGVVSVLLAFVLGFRLAGAAAGLAAALLLAVSPLDIQTSHMVRPDVMLAAFFLAALIVFDLAPSWRRGDAWAGLAIGAATAVKFTGVLLVPSYLLRRFSTPGARPRGMFLAGLASLAAFAVLSPYSILRLRSFADGIATQWSYHYAARSDSRTFVDKVVHDLWRLEDSFGVAAVALILAGVAFAARDGRRWWPALALPPVLIGMMATADVQWPRFLVPILGVLAILAGRAVAAVGARFGAMAAAVLALAAAAMPALRSVHHLEALQEPSAQDRTLDWIQAHATEGARILSSLKTLGLDRARFEVLTADSLGPDARRWAGHMDLVVSGPWDTLPAEDFDVVHAEEPRGVPLDYSVRVLVPRTSARPAYRAVALDPARVQASENAETARFMVDGDVSTFWRTEGAQVPDESWIEVELPERKLVGRVVLGLGKHWRREPKVLHVYVREGAEAWRRVRVFPGRAPAEQQPLPVGERSLELILDATPATAVRLVQAGRAGKHWNVAELRVDAVP